MGIKALDVASDGLFSLSWATCGCTARQLWLNVCMQVAVTAVARYIGALAAACQL